MSDYGSPTFRKVCDIEEPLAIVTDIVMGMAFIAETIGGHDQGSAIQRLGWLAKDHCDRIEAIREELFNLTHPTQGERNG